MSFHLPTIQALGTSWWIELFEDISEECRTVIFNDSAAFLSDFQKAYSRFDPASQISQLNSTHRLENPSVELQNLLAFGVAQFARTNGIFNIMVGSKLVETGYNAAYSFTPAETQTVIPNPADVLTIEPNAITLRAGHIDLGGFGKGYAIDALAKLLTGHGLKYFLINGGGDMYATSDFDTPITIYLEHPTVSETYLTTTTLLNQGFAASSPHKRSWKHAGTIYTHIIDTKATETEHPTPRPDATFSKAATACDADIFATVALLADSALMEQFAATEHLGVASFSLSDSSLSHNQAFV